MDRSNKTRSCSCLEAFSLAILAIFRRSPDARSAHRRPTWQQSSHHINHRHFGRRCNRLERISRPRPPPPRAPGSTKALLLLLATICGIQGYAGDSSEGADFVARNFKTSADQVRCGNVHTLATSTLYSPDARSALLNVLWLVISGRRVCRALGNTRFLTLFIGSGTVANTVSVTTIDGLPRSQSLGGAACAVDCIVTLNALLYPRAARRWKRWPLWLFSAKFLMRDEDEQAPGMHVTGMLCGLTAYLALRRLRQCFPAR